MKNLVPSALVSVHNVKCLIQCCAKRDWTDRNKQQKQGKVTWCCLMVKKKEKQLLGGQEY